MILYNPKERRILSIRPGAMETMMPMAPVMRPSLSFRLHSFLFPDIFPAHSPGKDKTAQRASNTKVEDFINSLTVSLEHIRKIGFVDEASKCSSACVDHDLSVDSWRVFPERFDQAVGEDCFREGEEDCSAEGLREDEDRYGDGDLRLGKRVLDGYNGLNVVSKDHN